MADERLEITPDEEGGSRLAVARVAELTRDCLLRHTELHEQLTGARNVFLDAQARQAFGPKPPCPLPDLADDVLKADCFETLSASIARSKSPRGRARDCDADARPSVSRGGIKWLIRLTRFDAQH